MKAFESSLSFLADHNINKLVIPFFQRRYVWNEDNWHEMLATLQNQEIQPFLGSIILKRHENNETDIVDGQQRLTTLTLLTKAIYDSFEKSERENGELKKHIETILFYTENLLEPVKKGNVKIRHSRVDAEDYNYIINAGLFDTDDVDLESISSNSSLIKQCYKFFREALKSFEKQDLLNLFNRLYFEQDENKKILVLIILNDKDINEQTIFDTINRAGVRLSTADIIKNNLFKRALDTCENNEELKNKTITYYGKYWEKTFYKTPEIIELWDNERVFGNVKHSNLEFLLYCIATIKWGGSKELFSKLELVYEKETKKMGNAEIIQLVKEIKEYADIFKKYIEDFRLDLRDEQKHIYFEYNDAVRRLLLILDNFGVQMFYPYVLKRIHDVDQNDSDENLIKDFHILESFVIRRKISPTKHTHDYTEKCIEIIKNGVDCLIQSDLQNIDSGVCDADVKTNLMYTKNDAAKMILFLIELYRRKNNDYDFDQMEYKYTLEHIMPRSWEKNWGKVKIIENGKELPSNTDEGIAYRKRMIEALGNKTLLTGTLNSTVRNASFDIKINGLENGKGYKNHTELLLTKEIVNAYNEDNIWDEEHIIKRTNRLYDEFITLWPSFSGHQPSNLENEPTYNDPDEMLNDIVNGHSFFNDISIVNNDLYDFLSYCGNRNINKYAYKDLLLLSILEKGVNGTINVSECAEYFDEFYDNRRKNKLTVEGKDSFIIKRYPYTISELEKEILTYPYDRFARKGYMEYNLDTKEISIVRQIWDQLNAQQIDKLKSDCKNEIKEYFEHL